MDATSSELNENQNSLQEEPVVIDLQQHKQEIDLQQQEQDIDNKNEPITNVDEHKDPDGDNQNNIIENKPIDNVVSIDKNDAKVATSESEPKQANVSDKYADNSMDKKLEENTHDAEYETDDKQKELVISEKTDEINVDIEATITNVPKTISTSEAEPKEANINDEHADNSMDKKSEENAHDVEYETAIKNDPDTKELVLSDKTDDHEIYVDNEETVKNDPDTKDPPSKAQRFIKNWAKIIFVFLAVATLSLVGVLIGINKPEEEAGIIVGLVCFNMVLSGLLMPIIGMVFIKAWTKNTWWLVFFIVYIAIIADVIAFGTYLQGLMQVLLTLYGVIKILLIVSAFIFAKVDGKHFIPSIISGYITMKFIKRETQLFKLIPLYVICLCIQLCMFSIGCLAFVIDDTDAPVALFIVALVLFIWLINTPRHFLSYMTARLLAKYLRKSENESINEDHNVVKLAFNDSYNKFMTITLGSFLVTTTPIWYFIVNLMTGIRIVTAVLVICCLPCTVADDDESVNACSCVATLITCASVIANGLAWVARKISKWTLRVTAKLLLISAGLLNITFWEAIVIQNTKIKEESKNTFGSDMLFLDNAVLSNNTHLCILISSIGAWLTYVIKPEATVICWIAGYCACRTMFEMVDVILLTFLIAWFVEPRIIYEDEILLEDFKIRTREMIERLIPGETDEFYAEAVSYLIHIEIEQVSGLRKTTDNTHITNVESTVTTIDAAKETKQIVHAPSGQIVAEQTNKAIMINQQTTAIDDRTEIISNTAIEMPNNNTITNENNDGSDQVR